MINELTSKQLFYADTAKANLGDNLSIEVLFSNLPSENIIQIDGYFKLSNPTVFMATGINPSVFCHIDVIQFERQNDSIYYFDIELELMQEDLLGKPAFILDGLSLAGSDTICTVEFFDLKYNGNNISQFNAIVIISSEYIPMRYSRFLNISNISPNPATIGNTMKVVFYIDIQTYVDIIVFDLSGRLFFLKKYSTLEKGAYNIDLLIDSNFSSGVYWVYVKGKSGVAWRKFVVFK